MPCPKIVTESVSELINNSDPVSLHGYTSAPGDINVRKALFAGIGMNRSGGDCHHFPRLIVDHRAVLKPERALAAGAVDKLPVLVGVPADIVCFRALSNKQNRVHAVPSLSAISRPSSSKNG